LSFKIPVAHIHGGEVTQGAIDDALRHSMTKLSHFHFASTQEYARRISQMGEEPWRIYMVGALSLDNLNQIELRSVDELSLKYKFSFMGKSPLLVTFHPITLEYEQTEWQIKELLTALDDFDLPVVFTKPNADTNGRVIIRLLEEYVRVHRSAWFVDNLGTQDYFSMMAIASVMVGNSSSGIVEAAMFKLPVVNIGKRQAGRMRSANIIDVDYKHNEITAGIHQALAPEFKIGLRDMDNPYGDGRAADRIVQILKQISLDEHVLIKRFADFSLPQA
jgi:UDP-N-acetylglucosamine 2-epimerase (non-hydrolysing)/GDP/UDP-N,N'-diacetylbacillosamine 2-epimerase (hydrolysing)